MFTRLSAQLLALALSLPGCASKPPPMRPPAPAPALPAVPPGEQVSVTGVLWDYRKQRKIAGALVILECECLAAPYETHTDASGHYSYRGLPPGRYRVRVLYAMIDINKAIDIPPGARFRANFSFDPSYCPHWQCPVQPDWKFVDRGLLRDDRCERWPGLCQR